MGKQKTTTKPATKNGLLPLPKDRRVSLAEYAAAMGFSPSQPMTRRQLRKIREQYSRYYNQFQSNEQRLEADQIRDINRKILELKLWTDKREESQKRPTQDEFRKGAGLFVDIINSMKNEDSSSAEATKLIAQQGLARKLAQLDPRMMGEILRAYPLMAAEISDIVNNDADARKAKRLKKTQAEEEANAPGLFSKAMSAGKRAGSAMLDAAPNMLFGSPPAELREPSQQQALPPPGGTPIPSTRRPFSPMGPPAPVGEINNPVIEERNRTPLPVETSGLRTGRNRQTGQRFMQLANGDLVITSDPENPNNVGQIISAK